MSDYSHSKVLCSKCLQSYHLGPCGTVVVNALAAPAADPMVHDFHSDNDQYASVTGRAQKAWVG